MTILNKLDTFILRDQFGWDRQQLLAEANDMAIRHSEMMGWESVEVKDITVIPAKIEQYLCYQFEIWGVGTPALQVGDDAVSESNSTKAPPQAAKQPEL